MKKSDLRTGMYIVFVNSEMGRVFMNTGELHDDFFVLHSEEGMSHKLQHLPMSLDDWTLYGGVIQVFKPTYKKYYLYNYHNLSENMREVFWEKKEKHTLSLTLDGKSVEREISDETYNVFKELLEELK